LLRTEDNKHTYTFTASTPILAPASIKNLRDLEARPPLPPRLLLPSASTMVQRNIVPRAHHCWTYGLDRNQDKHRVTSRLAPVIER
jgi:hypothetical protein